MSALPMWVVYGPNQIEHPGRYVVREWLASAAGVQVTGACFVEETLAQVRARVPDGLLRLPRETRDDPSIIEVWL